METKHGIGVGIIGFGDGGMCNARSLLQIERANLVAVCDIDSERLVQGPRELGISPASYLAYGDLLRDQRVELVIVATPDHCHLAPTIAALQAGKHVFVEKPVATSVSDLEVFEKLARSYDGKLHFSENHSFTPQVEAALSYRDALGDFLTGSTLYAMWNCDRIMGGGKWRTETEYNPCAGGLSHNFMIARLFSGAPIARVRATGHVLTYHESLDRTGGYDTMEGVIEFANGRCLNWSVCLAIAGANSPYGHRPITHYFQFRNGVLAFGPTPESDRLVVGGAPIVMEPEASPDTWWDYFIGLLYHRMHEDIIAGIYGESRSRHTIQEGINVARACVGAFVSAKADGVWVAVE